MIAALGMNPFTGIPLCAPYPVAGVVCSDAVWWLLETLAVLGALWPRLKPRKPLTVLWFTAVWLLMTAARFAPTAAFLHR
jgi:hypothetical protein